MVEEEEIEVNYDYLMKFEGNDVFEAKFNIMTTLQPKAFDKETYKPEDKIVIQNEKGEDEIKEIPLTNYIRWRNVDKKASESNENEDEIGKDLDDSSNKLIGLRNTNTNKTKESNAKIVEWSDGSFQLIIGDEYYDIMFSNMDNVRFGIEDRENNLLIVNKPIKKRMILTPSEFCSHVKKVEKVINQDESNLKVKLAYSFYDKQKYNKEEFNNKYGKKNRSPPMKLEKNLNKKRKRSGNSDF